MTAVQQISVLVLGVPAPLPHHKMLMTLSPTPDGSERSYANFLDARHRFRQFVRFAQRMQRADTKCVKT